MTFDQQDDSLERRITRGLETSQTFTIPPDFAARTASAALRLQVLRPTAVTPSRVSKLVIQAVFAALLVAMFAFAPQAQQHATRSTFPVLIELLLALEFVALTTWLSLRPVR